MALKLKKDSVMSLTKKAPALVSLRIESGWEKLQKSLDLDLSVFGLDAQGVAMESHAVFFNQVQSADGAIKHSGDNRVGGADVVEAISVNLQELAQKSPHITEVSVIMTIDRAVSRGHTFGLLKNAFVRLVNAATNEVIVEYDLDDQFSTSISVQVGSLVKQDNAWEFKEVAMGYPDKSFEDIAQKLGL